MLIGICRLQLKLIENLLKEERRSTISLRGLDFAAKTNLQILTIPTIWRSAKESLGNLVPHLFSCFSVGFDFKNFL